MPTHELRVTLLLTLTREPTPSELPLALTELCKHLMATTLLSTRPDRKRIGVIKAVTS